LLLSEFGLCSGVLIVILFLCAAYKGSCTVLAITRWHRSVLVLDSSSGLTVPLLCSASTSDGSSGKQPFNRWSNRLGPAKAEFADGFQNF